jgi:hypothetical protein
VAGLPAEARVELRANATKTKAGSDPGLFIVVIPGRANGSAQSAAR